MQQILNKENHCRIDKEPGEVSYQRKLFCKGKKRLQRLHKLARAALPAQDFSCTNQLAESINTTRVSGQVLTTCPYPSDKTKRE